jgi:Ca2+-binding EF-hand superfamily protein
MRFREMDRNRDGRITRDEWPGSDRSFNNHDWNNDGVLSEDEVRFGGRQGSFETADHDPNRFERNLGWTRGNFMAYDHNRDGRLTANEWHFDTETFRRIDRNRDNAISLQEFLGEANYDDDRDESFDDMDWNNDGRVERNEWHGSLSAFRALDRNNDGVLSRYEVVGSQPSFDTYNEFANLDYDRDGNLSRNEWHGSQSSFTRYDTNRDGVISRREYEATGGQIGGAPSYTGIRTVQVDPRQRWTDSGIAVRAGDVITFNASGSITMRNNDAGDPASPAGSTRGRTANDAPIRGALAGALIAKIDNYGAMLIGDRGSIRMPVSGRLYLGVNDDLLTDNSGSFTVAIGVQGTTYR